MLFMVRMKKVLIFFIITLLEFNLAYSKSSLTEFEHGLRFRVTPKDQLNLNFKNNDFSLNSNTSLGFEFGYVLKSKGKYYVETGFSYLIDNLKYDLTLRPIIPVAEIESAFPDNYYIYNKIPLSVGARFKISNIPFHLKLGMNFLFMRPTIFKNITTYIDQNNTSTVFYNSEFSFNPNFNFLKSKSISLGTEYIIYKNIRLVSELFLESTNSKNSYGKAYINVYPNDARNFIHTSEIITKLNMGLDLTVVF